MLGMLPSSGTASYSAEVTVIERGGVPRVLSSTRPALRSVSISPQVRREWKAQARETRAEMVAMKPTSPLNMAA